MWGKEKSRKSGKPVFVQRLLILFTLLCLNGCLGGSQPVEKSPSQTPVQPTLTLGATPFPQITEKLPSPTRTSLPTLTPTEPDQKAAEILYETRCVEPAPLESLHGTGYLYLHGYQTSVSKTPDYRLDLGNGAIQPIDDSWNFWEWSFSPDEKWVINYPGVREDGTLDEDKIPILSSDGKEVLTFEKAIGSFDWLDNNHLKITNLIEGTDLLSVVVLNPFSGEQQMVPVDLPEIYPYKSMASKQAYDPTASFVVYPYSTEDSFGYRLWDVYQHQILASVESMLPLYTPRWSPDGSRVIVPGISKPLGEDPSDTGLELFMLDLQGNVVQLTDLESRRASLYIMEGIWSPDGRYFAFWYKRDDESLELALIDIENKKVMYLCGTSRENTGSEQIVWSPDSKQISGMRRQDGLSTAFVVDMDARKIFEIGENIEPFFWLKAPPGVWDEFILP